MGKIFSAPKAPKLPDIPVIVDTTPATVTTTVTASDTSNPPSGSGGDSQDNAPELTPDEQRVQNILTRNRGRVGTITTSFNGVLNNAISNLPARKTLLGE